jgi:hypothetical protein
LHLFRGRKKGIICVLFGYGNLATDDARTQEAREMPGEGEQITGVSDNAYNLTSVLYHAAQGGRSTPST